MLEWIAFPSPGDLPDPGILPGYPALQVDSLPSKPPGKPCIYMCICSLYSTGLTFCLPVYCSIKVLPSVLLWYNKKIHLASLQCFLLPASWLAVTTVFILIVEISHFWYWFGYKVNYGMHINRRDNISVTEHVRMEVLLMSKRKWCLDLLYICVYIHLHYIVYSYIYTYIYAKNMVIFLLSFFTFLNYILFCKYNYKEASPVVKNLPAVRSCRRWGFDP